jgi:hypothetical protein
MSVDSTREHLKATKEVVRMPFKEIVMNRKAEKRKRDQDDNKRRMIGIGMSLNLDHINDYIELDEEYEIENRTSRAYEIRRKLEPVVTEVLMSGKWRRKRSRNSLKTTSMIARLVTQGGLSVLNI